MSTLTLLPRGSLRALAITCAAIYSQGVLPAQSSATVDLYRIPEPTTEELERIPKNLARWHMGATLILVKDDQFQRIQVPDVGYFEESIFLSDNSALTYTIENGRHDYIIDLGQFMRVSRFFLNNQSASGDFQLFKSDTLEDVESDAWIALTKEIDFKSGELPSVTFPEVETRFIMVRFDISKSGTIGNFGATGPLKITQAEFTLGKGESEEELIQAQSPIIDYDFASAYTGTRIAYVSGGPIDKILNLLDEDPTTTYEFPSNEECIIIVDMKKETQVRTFAAQYSTQTSGLVQVYFLDQLPSYFEDSQGATGVATYEDDQGMLQRAELAATGGAYTPYLAAQSSHEVVSVPLDYFKEIEDSYSVRVSANEDRALQIFDDLERRYAIFRFVPEGAGTESVIQTALYRPGQQDFQVQSAQGRPGITFGQVEVVGNVEFDDIIFTMETEDGDPGGPPEDPPDDPPVISE
ncbi:hypothetical protein DDZ13_01230 [Coraliomargarita sinensis]|uniref:Uncharacterized protein n=1 Tax=Coraliomargarita sinensis TaxID=2174842 RepID=A0A317ZMQ6_9BACT|nr:hypothetical protein [Coraliomargarita sinensis]PXA05523.1 hypothetical protein DDZ13_01230 [Coraliomargarita sinensis]